MQLVPVARVMLSVPASSVDAERTFSSAGFIDDPLRNRLENGDLGRLVVIRDWVLSNYMHRTTDGLKWNEGGERQLIDAIAICQKAATPAVVIAD